MSQNGPGLEAASAHVTQPAVDTVQVAKDHGKGDAFKTIAISGAVNGGAMLLIK